MQIIPIIPHLQRDNVTTAVRLLTSPIRAITYILGGILGSIVAGFIQGWRDTP